MSREQRSPTREPFLSFKTTEMMFEADLLNVVSTKEPTKGCDEAVPTRIVLGYGTMQRGVPIESEIKTALFLAKSNTGESLFIAAHIQANEELSSSGALKAEIEVKTGLKLIGKLDREAGLAQLNSNLAPVYEIAKGWDKRTLSEIKDFIENGEDDDDAPIKPRLETASKALEAHIENPEIKPGELNPWTLLLLTQYSHAKQAAELNIKPMKVLHLVEEKLTRSRAFSTTNAGSRYLSMTIQNTAKAFEFLQAELEELHENNFTGSIVSDKFIQIGRQPSH